MRIPTRILAAVLALLAMPSARADTVEASSTTFLTAGQQTSGGLPGQKPDLLTVVPLWEVLSLSAREIRNPAVENLSIVLQTWGSVELAHKRWDAGTNSDLNGDVVTGYISGQLFDRHLTLRLGREFVSMGTARMIQLDGGDAVVWVPVGPVNVEVSGYVGSPVSQRFQRRTEQVTWNPAGGDFAYGGRLGLTIPIPGVSGRGLDIGGSAAFVDDGSRPARQDVGGDLRFQPFGNFTLVGYGLYSIYDERWAEGNALVSWNPVNALHLNLDWRFTAPDLFLPRDSILSVFSAERRNDYGGGLALDLTRELTLGVDYHLLVEPGEGKDYFGNELLGRISWARGQTRAGLEGGWLDSFENGYSSGRVYGRQDFGPLFAAADVIFHRFRNLINDQRYALTGTLTGGWLIGAGWSAVVSGTAGTTPYFDQTYSAMVKLAYNQTYHVREVR